MSNPDWKCFWPFTTLTSQVHLAMVRYHEAGRFCEKDEQWDESSAMFHLERAALCGELEAIVALGQCYLRLPHHILPDMELEVSWILPLGLLLGVTALTGLVCWQDNAGNRMKGFKYLLQAAEAGDRSSMIIVARAFDSGINLSADRSVWIYAQNSRKRVLRSCGHTGNVNKRTYLARSWTRAWLIVFILS